MSPKVLAILIATTAFVASALATKGVDVSQAVSLDAWKCINRDNDFAIVRVFQSNGKIDPNGADNIKNAHAAGIKYVDGYVFPCKNCQKLSAKAQAQMTVDHLRKQNAKFGQLWIDIEQENLWHKNPKQNVKFIQELVNELKALKVVPAIYSSQVQWKPIMGDSDDFKALPLWYAHYDGKPNFSDFKEFGGWKKPAIKQYKGTTTLCKVGVDLNWYP